VCVCLSVSDVVQVGDDDGYGLKEMDKQ